MSENAERALINAGSKLGAIVVTDEKTLRELQELGMVGRNCGLTRKGSIKAHQLMTAKLDALFGPEC